jgi:hypothetical protein
MPRIIKYKANYYDLLIASGFIYHGYTPIFVAIVTSLWMNEYIEYLKNNDDYYFNLPEPVQMPKHSIILIYEKENKYSGFRGVIQIKSNTYQENTKKIFRDNNYNLVSADIESISIFENIVELKNVNIIYNKNEDKCNSNRGFMSKYLVNHGVNIISQCLGIKLLKFLQSYIRHNYIFKLKKIEREKEIAKIKEDIERSRSEKISLDDIKIKEDLEEIKLTEQMYKDLADINLSDMSEADKDSNEERDVEDEDDEDDEEGEIKEEPEDETHKQGLIPILTVKCEDFKFPVITFDKSEIDKLGNSPDDYAKIKYYISHTFTCEKCITINNNQIEFASLLFESYDSMYMKKLEDNIDVLNAKKHYQSCKKYNPFGEVSKNSIMILDVERNIFASEYRSYANTIFVIVVRSVLSNTSKTV